MIDALLRLQQTIYDYHNDDEYPYSLSYSPKVSFFPVGDLVGIKYHGPGYEDDPSMKIEEFDEGYNFGFCALLDFLTNQEYANKVISLVFDSFDEGANGVNEWCFERLTESEVVFPNLEELKIRLTDLGDHNISAINYLEEDGTIAKLVKKMPNLKRLVVPAAPDSSFFDFEHTELQSMVVQAGSDTQDFLGNLAKSDKFPALYSLDYAEPLDQFNDLGEEDYTSVETFKELFASKAFSHQHFHFKLRNSILTEEQLFDIQKTNTKVQFLYINSQAGKYVNHMMK
ncbi:MAG: hypothetical protein E6767_07990 [Dysgonomonas sp.]|nr:hypothetical protein [Dysgonomonas sp.]